jgi:uncharacterized protein YbaR (Trm112 family)
LPGFFVVRGDNAMALDKRLLDILVCPKCKGTLQYDRENSKLICRSCKLAYPIRDDIPVMLEEEAERIE